MKTDNSNVCLAELDSRDRSTRLSIKQLLQLDIQSLRHAMILENSASLMVCRSSSVDAAAASVAAAAGSASTTLPNCSGMLTLSDISLRLETGVNREENFSLILASAEFGDQAPTEGFLKVASRKAMHVAEQPDFVVASFSALINLTTMSILQKSWTLAGGRGNSASKASISLCSRGEVRSSVQFLQGALDQF